MAVIKTGTGEGIHWEVDPSFDAAKVAFRSMEYRPTMGAGGAFRTRLATGITAAGTAAGILFSFMNPNSAIDCVIVQVVLELRPTTGNTVGSIAYDLFATRGFSAIDTGGATLSANFGLQNRLDPFASNNFQARMAIATTGTLTPGTGTDDAQALAGLVFPHPGNISAPSTHPFFPAGNVNSTASKLSGLNNPLYPLVCAQNEGFRVRMSTNFPGGSDAGIHTVAVEWFEVPTGVFAA